MAFHEALREKRLLAHLEANPVTGNAVLYQFASDLVYDRFTRRVERARGHHRCAMSMTWLLPECHDRHQDLVEALRADLLRNADRPIENVRGWMAARLNAVTIDAARRRRGAQAAMQRPRVPGWLRSALGDDPWLTALALEILAWVGVPAASAGGLWPLGMWAERRAEATGDHDATESRIVSDVERVLSAMRTKREWYERYVEQPLGRKSAPVAPDLDAGPPLAIADAGDAALLSLAEDAIAAINARIGRGEDARAAVLQVLTAIFGEDATPIGGPEAEQDATRIAILLSDSSAHERIVDEVLSLIIGAGR